MWKVSGIYEPTETLISMVREWGNTLQRGQSALGDTVKGMLERVVINLMCIRIYGSHFQHCQELSGGKIKIIAALKSQMCFGHIFICL